MTEERDNLSRRRLSIQKELDEYVQENELCHRLMTISGIQKERSIQYIEKEHINVEYKPKGCSCVVNFFL